MSRLLDERSSPSLRTILGDLLRRATHADIAVANIRLAVLDLADSELATVRRCRILIGRLDARALHPAAPTEPAAHTHAHALLHFLASERVEIRSCGLATWTPDFSVFRELDQDPAARVALVGAHWFREPVAIKGPSFTDCIDDPIIVDLVAARFDELWHHGHDVRDAVVTTIQGWKSAART